MYFYRMKRTLKIGPSKISLSFQLARKLDSSVEDSDTNVELKDSEKTNYEGSIGKFFLSLAL